jgi:hypothetical protein
MRHVPPKLLFIQEPHGSTSQKWLLWNLHILDLLLLLHTRYWQPLACLSQCTGTPLCCGKEAVARNMYFCWSCAVLVVLTWRVLDCGKASRGPFICCIVGREHEQFGMASFWKFHSSSLNRHCFKACKICGSHCGNYDEFRLLGYKNSVRTSQETQYVSATESSQLMLCKIWGFHGNDYEECRLGYKNPVRTSQQTQYVSATESSQLMLCKIGSFHGSDYEECRLGYKNPVRTSQETHYFSAIESSQLMLCKIWGFHGYDYEECRLLGC